MDEAGSYHVSASTDTATTTRKRREGDEDDILCLIHETSEWLDGLLKPKKDGAAGGRRVMSPATEQSIRLLIQQYSKAAGADAETRMRISQEIALGTIRREVSRRLEADERYLGVRLKLEKLMEKVSYIKYGDYYATSLHALRDETHLILKRARSAAAAAKIASDKEAKKFGKTTKKAGESSTAATKVVLGVGPERQALHQFVSTKWSELDVAMELEEKSAAAAGVLPVSTPLSDLLHKIVLLIPGTTYAQARDCMKMYAQRNKHAHINIGDLAKKKLWGTLGDQILRDLADLERQTTMTDKQKDATKQAIWYNIGLHFKVFVPQQDMAHLAKMLPWPEDKNGKPIRMGGRPTPPKCEDASEGEELDATMEEGDGRIAEEDVDDSSVIYTPIGDPSEDFEPETDTYGY